MDRILNARPDTPDFRDCIYLPALIDVPGERPLDQYLKRGVPVLDQGTEGACTGFGLATVANYLLATRRVRPSRTSVSPRMLYEMARRYDEWPGEDYDGSSARGAMKGWHKHGVCSERLWPYRSGRDGGHFTDERAQDARSRPLGAYYRVNHRSLVDLHCALTEVGVLYATASVHAGWDRVGDDGIIPFEDEMLGGHAFAIVAYDREGLWIQNSWGEGWGKDGFGRLCYDDWLANGTDVWVARLGAPVALATAEGTATNRSAAAYGYEAYSFSELRPHIISLGNNGRLRASGTYGTSKEDVAAILREDLAKTVEPWPKRRVLLYAHGGLVAERDAIQRVADYRSALLENQIYPLCFIWESDFWSTLRGILQDALDSRRPEGFLDSAHDFMLDRLDDALEPLARSLSGKLQWDEMRENALLATTSQEGGARFTVDTLAQLVGQDPDRWEIHVVGHSAGSIFHAPLVQLLAGEGTLRTGPLKGKKGLGLKIASCTLWAPACTLDLFRQTYLPLIKRKRIERFHLFTLTDRAERDDHCAGIYHKSLLYLVSNALGSQARIPLFRDGERLLGMEKFVREDREVMSVLKDRGSLRGWVLAPNNEPVGSPNGSGTQHHGDFDDDPATVRSTLARLRPDLASGLDAVPFPVHRGTRSLAEQRRELSAPPETLLRERPIGV